MALFSKPKNNSSYLTIEKARVSFIPNQDRIQITGKLNGKSIKHAVPAGSSLEQELRDALVVQYLESTPEEQITYALPDICFLNHGKNSMPKIEDINNADTMTYTCLKPDQTYYFKNAATFQEPGKSIRVPLGISQNPYQANDVTTYFYTPFLSSTEMAGVTTETQMTNIFLTGSPGSGKSITASTIIDNLKYNDPEMEIIVFNPLGNSYGSELKVPVVSDPLELLLKLRGLKRRQSKSKNVFFVIEEIDHLISSSEYNSPPWHEERADKAVRAEILQSIISLSRHKTESLQVSFAFTSQSPTPQHHGIIETCGTIVGFKSMNASDAFLDKTLFGEEIFRSQLNKSGEAYIKQGAYLKPIKTFVSLNIN